VARRAPRIAFYCHNVHGLGHIARSAMLARETIRTGAECLIITGCSALAQINIPDRAELVTLPPVLWRDGRFVPADPSMATHEVLRERGRQIADRCRQWQPDVLVADHSPLGLGGELVAALTAAREERWSTRFVWGLPYAEGVPADQAPPANPRIRAAVSSYGAALAYVPRGDEFFDRLPAWMVPETRVAVGYVADAPLPPTSGPPGLIVVACGGGTTAFELCRDALHARQQLPVPRPPMRLVVGPLGDADAIQRLVSECDASGGVSIAPHGELREVIRDAAVVVSRAGYNSVALLLQTPLALILVPAIYGSLDQVSRADGLRGTSGVWVTSTRDADHVAGLSRAMAEAAGFVPAGARLTADGAGRAAEWLVAEAARS
jgi:predicted glycosyltransferase